MWKKLAELQVKPFKQALCYRVYRFLCWDNTNLSRPPVHPVVRLCTSQNLVKMDMLASRMKFRNSIKKATEPPARLLVPDVMMPCSSIQLLWSLCDYWILRWIPTRGCLQTSEDRESGSLPGGKKKPHFRNSEEWKRKKARIIRKIRTLGRLNLALLLARMPVSIFSNLALWHTVTSLLLKINKRLN